MMKKISNAPNTKQKLEAICTTQFTLSRYLLKIAKNKDL